MEHLSLNWRKVLCARIAVLSATQKWWPDVRVKELDGAFDVLERHLLLRASSLEQSADQETLTKALGNLVHELNIGAITGASDPLFDATLESLRHSLSQIDCTQCSAAPTCPGNPQIVAHHGKCIDFFRRWFIIALQESQAWHVAHSTSQLIDQVTVDFSTSYFANPPDSLNVARHVSAKTTFPDNPLFHSEVKLLLNVPEFELESLAACPYILLHELICHAFQGTRRATTNRDRRSREIDSFSEGWMDWLTFRIFLDLMSRHKSQDIDTPLVSETVSRYRAARQGRVSDVAEQRHRAFFSIGEQAAQVFHAFLNSNSAAFSAGADELFYKISFQWSLDGDSTERTRFVTLVRQILQFERKPDKLSWLRNAVKKYEISGELRDLVKELPN